MSHQTTAWPAHAAMRARQRGSRAAIGHWTRPTKALLAMSSAVMIALAVACAWLSYHAQVGYVRAHNGDETEQARVWAVLLDAGTAGVSMLRLHETLRMRRGAATRFTLLGCISLSVTMNLLHAPSQSLGGYLVAAVPPVMYAVFLEHLLTTLRSLIAPDEERRSLTRSIALWIHFPRTMWCTWRGTLRREAEGFRQAQESGEEADQIPAPAGETEHIGSRTASAKRREQGRKGRGLGVKRLAFESVLVAQVRAGDLRVFSGRERERNEAAYEAAASLPAPLSPGTARKYVVQALSRVREATQDEQCLFPAPAQEVA